MYTDTQNFEEIMRRMLSRIPNGIDKREGSIIWDALAPAALEIESIYYALDGVVANTFASTSSREYLILRARERGLVPFKATKSIVKAKFNTAVEKGVRFNANGIIFKVLEVIDSNENTYKLECEETGEVGNINEGDLVQIDFIQGLSSAKIVELLVIGKKEEDTEEFRKRYFNSFEEQAFGGNIADYQEKTLAVEGVGAVKVTPVWNGGGTVKLTVLDANLNKANNDTISKVQEKIDPRKDGSGVGLAPIGHIVTVETAEEVNINISMRVSFVGSMTFEEKKEKFKEVIELYFKELKKNWHKESIILRPAHIISRLLNINNVEDITELKINNQSSNLKLTEFQIPKLNEVIKL